MIYCWVVCGRCDYHCIAPFVEEFGFLVATESHGEECQECGSQDMEVSEEYDGGGL